MSDRAALRDFLLLVLACLVLLWLVVGRQAPASSEAQDRAASPAAPGLRGTPEQTASLSGIASPGSVSAVGSDAPYPAEPQDSSSGVPQATGEIGTALIGGYATWYATPGYTAAAGPVLRDVLGSEWRGSVVVVEHHGKTVAVQLTDFCACGERAGLPTFLDLSDAAFAELAPLSAGVIEVSVEIGAQPLPPTDLPPHPDDERMRDEVLSDDLYR